MHCDGEKNSKGVGETLTDPLPAALCTRMLSGRRSAASSTGEGTPEDAGRAHGVPAAIEQEGDPDRGSEGTMCTLTRALRIHATTVNAALPEV